jgi:WD40 repeat protein
MALDQTTGLLYTTDMALAYQAHEKGWSDEARSLLDKYVPVAGATDRRGFEWRLLSRVVQPPSSSTLAGHRGAVNELAVFPDGQRLASVGQDGTLLLWDVHGKELLKSFALSDQPLLSVAISPDGRRVAAASNNIYLIDLEGDSHGVVIHRGDHGIESLAFSPDGQRLVAASHYHDVCLLSLDGELLKRISCSSRGESLDFIPSSQSLLLVNRRRLENSDESGFIQVWDDALSEIHQELDATNEEERGLIAMARSSPCGRFVAAGDVYRATAFLFDRATGRLLLKTPAARDRLSDLAYSPDGRSIATAYENGCVGIFTLQPDLDGVPRTIGLPLAIDAHHGKAACVRFISPSTLASCGADGLIRLFDLRSQGARGLDVTNETVLGLQFSPDGNQLLCVCTHELAMINAESGNVHWRLSRPQNSLYQAVWSPSGERIAVSMGNPKTLAILDRNGKPVCSVACPVHPYDVAFSTDGSLIGIIGREQLKLYRACDGGEEFSQSLPNEGNSLAFSHDGARLAYSGELQGISVISLKTKQTLLKLRCDSRVCCLAFSPDDSILASGHRNSTVRLWESPTGRLRAEMTGHERIVDSLAFSPDARMLLSSGADCVVRAWSVDSGRAYGMVCQRNNLGNFAVACKFSLSSNGRFLAVAYRPQREDDPDVLLWDLNSPASLSSTF